MPKDRMQRLAQARVCLLFTPDLCIQDPWHTLEECLAAGLEMVQVRDKTATSRQLLDLSRQVVEVVSGRALVVVNDRPDIALLSHADGVHLGQGDLPAEAARELGKGELLLGISTHDTGQIQGAVRDQADYLGFGPMFATPTKGYPEGLGPEAWIEVQSLVPDSLPVFLIGGITPENLSGITEARHMAVASAILQSPRPGQALEKLHKLLSP